ncbi:MAG: MarC family protein [Hyphomonadaceae bacterium]
MSEVQIEQAIAAFVTFFVVINAVGVAPVFAALTEGDGPAFARKMAVRSTIVATLVIFLFAFAGPWLLENLGISLDAFRIAGGALLFLIALEMVFEKRQERQKNRADAVLAEGEASGGLDDISVFPIGIPMIAGPGAIATAMLYMRNAGGDPVNILIVVAAIGANLLLVLVTFLIAGPLMRLMGESIAGAITRIFGVILAALAIQFMVDGLKAVFLTPAA